ncbi:hypothetical protein, partial [Salmonella sp. s51228]|uniref:hypothetical protein n=1 Tax=Salmonella sp. s51228 TaxID=3159652 RepID=UPI00397F66FF
QISPALVATEFAGRLEKDMETGTDFYCRNAHLETEDVSNAALYLLSTPAGVCVHDLIIRSTFQET